MTELQFVANQLISIIMPLTRAVASELRHAETSLNPAHIGVLAILADRPCNLSELAEYQGVSLPTMSGSISRLEKRGWVQRERSSADRRIVMVELTPKGRQRLAEMVEHAEEYLVGLLASLTPDEREAVSSSLTVLQKLFK